MSIALLVVSDRASRGERADKCEAALLGFLEIHGQTLAHCAVVPDEADQIGATLSQWADSGKYDLILSAGGTGLSPRDVTPEATLPILEKVIPGIPEAMRAASLKITDRAPLSRGHAGIRKGSMIINLPGSPKASVENLSAVFGAVIHGIDKAQGDQADCGVG
ncbi:MAG: MogA/MoaB family molybdenum cofactor biosynthesis protein [Nitrospinae bacterium]|nr:MogA/MoaB family molybdenum cofactor biosynthesis protein [Nitrospinota bacterium]